MIDMASELEKIEEVKKYIEATIAEIDSHTENMEKLFKICLLYTSDAADE